MRPLVIIAIITGCIGFLSIGPLSDICCMACGSILGNIAVVIFSDDDDDDGELEELEEKEAS